MICARGGCSRELPEIAIQHGDDYCSTECCKLDHGLIAIDDYKKSADAKKRAGARADKINHGTVHAYQYYKCKCQKCLKAGRDYAKLKEQRRRNRAGNSG